MTIYGVFREESESELKNYQIFHPEVKITKNRSHKNIGPGRMFFGHSWGWLIPDGHDLWSHESSRLPLAPEQVLGRF